jgi:hypothetical protein
MLRLRNPVRCEVLFTSLSTSIGDSTGEQQPANIHVQPVLAENHKPKAKAKAKPRAINYTQEEIDELLQHPLCASAAIFHHQLIPFPVQ